MIQSIVFDFGRVFVFPKDQAYFGSINDLHRVLSENPHYNFLDNFEFNTELMDLLLSEELGKKYELYLVTKGSIADAAECKNFYKKTFVDVISCDKLGLNKSLPSCFTSLAERINLNPAEILYIDDERKNTEAAEKAGFNTITFRNNIQLETELKGFIR